MYVHTVVLRSPSKQLIYLPNHEVCFLCTYFAMRVLHCLYFLYPPRHSVFTFLVVSYIFISFTIRNLFVFIRSAFSIVCVHNFVQNSFVTCTVLCSLLCIFVLFTMKSVHSSPRVGDSSHTEVLPCFAHHEICTSLSMRLHCVYFCYHGGGSLSHQKVCGSLIARYVHLSSRSVYLEDPNVIPYQLLCLVNL
jgi:hypothetical protein